MKEAVQAISSHRRNRTIVIGLPLKEQKGKETGENSWRALFSLNLLLLFVPLSFYLEYFRPQAHTLIFFSACLGIIPLAGWMGSQSEEPLRRRIL